MRFKTFSAFVTERAVPIQDILVDSAQQGLVVSDRRSGGSVERKLAIYDFDDKAVLGFISMDHWKGDDHFELGRAVATQGYGPDVYDMALMSAWPLPIVPSSTIKPAALAVWRFYSEHRPDCRKEPIPDGVEKRDKFDNSLTDRGNHDPAALRIINTRYYLEPSSEFRRLLERGEELCSKYRITPAAIVKSGDRGFWQVYDK